jgi:hypothetical protein
MASALAREIPEVRYIRSEAAALPGKESVNKTVNTAANAACFPIFPLATPAQSPI